MSHVTSALIMGKQMWLVAYAVRSETATVAVVEADDEQQAKECALALEQAADSFWGSYVQRAIADGRVTVERIRDGLRVNVNAPH